MAKNTIDNIIGCEIRKFLHEHDNHYTQYSDIENELVEYSPYFENKTVLLCCDKPYISEFWNFFQNNLRNLSIPMVVSTFWSNNNEFPAKITILTKNGVSEKPLKGNGDFLSDEIINIMSYIDIVVTNPPFSNGMFSNFLQQLKKLGKKFIVIGPTVSSYSGKVFDMFKKGEISMGHNYDMKFLDQLDGGKPKRKQTSWFTNLDTPEKGDFAKNEANIGDFQKYDNTDAINFNFVRDIPTNYNGMIGVPPSVINSIDLNLYDILDSRDDLKINGEKVPRRFIIQRKKGKITKNVAEQRIINGLDKIHSLLERIDPNYKQYIQIINESDSRLNVVNRIIEQVFGSSYNLDSTVNDKSSTTWRQYILYNLRHTFGLMRNSDVKYLPVVARLAFSDEVMFCRSKNNSQQIIGLQQIVQEMKNNEKLFQEIKSNPNITFSQLYSRFSKSFNDRKVKEENAANNITNNGNKYTIKELTDFKTANYYGNYTCSESKICYTQDEDVWMDYTGNGINRAYVCLMNGWENVPEKATEGNPYDLYGISMIFVIISPNGDIACSNCRWNHMSSGNVNFDVDHAFSKDTLSKTIGMPFNSVFKPFSQEYILKYGIENGQIDLSNIAVGNFSIPNGITIIGNKAFRNCTNLITVDIPSSVSEISYFAFFNCKKLTSVLIPSTVETIKRGAFYGCSNLTVYVESEQTAKMVRASGFEGNIQYWKR